MKGWRPGRVSLQATAFAVAALCMLILTGIFTFFGITALNQSTNQVLDQRLLLAQVSADRVDYALGRALSQVQETIRATSVPREYGPEAMDLYERLKQQLSSPLPLQTIVFLDREGEVLWAAPPLSIPDNVDFSSQDQVVRALGSGMASISNSVLGLIPGRALIFLSVPATGPAGDVVGLVQAGIAPDESGLGLWIRSLALGQTGFGEIVDHSGIVLASTQPEDLFKSAEHGPQFASLIDRGTTTMGGCHNCHETGRRKDILAFAPLTAAPWGVAIQQAEEEAFSPVQRLRRSFALVAAGALLGALAVGWIATRYISRPVRAIAVASRKIACGDFSSALKPDGPRELYSLAQDFETMRSSLKASRHRMAEWQDELEQKVADRTRNLASLVGASEALISSLDPDAVLKSVVEGAVKSFEADAGALFLWNAAEGQLRGKAAIGYDLKTLGAVSLRPGEGVAGRVFSTGQAAWSSDASHTEEELSSLSEENHRLLLAARGGRDVSAFLCVPLVFRERTLGSLFLARLREGADYTPFHVELASTFARIASALLENIRLLHEASEAQALRQADQLKTGFLSNITHDLKTPLATLKAALGFLPATFAGEAGSPQASLVENARRSANRLERLVDELVDIARLQNLQFKLDIEPLDLCEVVREAVESFRPLLDEKSQVIQAHFPDCAVVVRGDERRLEQVLDNLIMNAHLYSGSPGRITVTLISEGGRAMVSVADGGPGLTPLQIDHVFERFYRGSPDHEGLGLGLAIAKGIMELHGGSIWAESEEGKGSKFSFALPMDGVHEDNDRR